MAHIPLASDLSYLVAQKRRRELQGAHLSADQPAQGVYPRVVTGIRGDILRAMFSPDVDGDGAQVTPTTRALGEQD